MKKNLLLLIFSAFLLADGLLAQTTYTSAVSDITLQCSNSSVSGTGNRTGVAYNPCQNLYYSVNAGNSSYPIETFSATGGNPVNTTSQGADYRGLWWNNANNRVEGNVYNSGGVYSNSLTASGYAVATVSFIASASMPNVQSNGHANIAGNIIYYYDNGVLYRYNKSSNALISSTSITGLPAATSNLNTYGVVYTGYPGSDVAVYNYVSRVIYFINSTTAAYTSSCSLPSSAPAASAFMMGFANNRFFLFNSSSLQWYGYPIGNAPPSTVSTATVAASSTNVCSGYSVNLTASGALSYSWSVGGSSSSVVVTPTISSIYTVVATSSTGCIGINTIAVSVIPSSLTAAASPTSICTGGSATLSAGGANSYTWSTSSNSQSIVVNPSSTTSYTLQGTNSQGCINNAVVTVTVSGSVPVLSIVSSTNQTCLGKTATLTASGALTYTWSNSVTNGVSFNPSVTTTYTVTGGNGCGTSSAVTTITVAPLPITIISNPTLVCAGQTSTITTASAATSFTWFPANAATSSVIVTPTATTIYSLVATDGTCSGTATISISANPVPTVLSSASATNICQGNVVTLSASGGSSYTWTPGNLSGPSVTVSPTAPTLYSVAASNSFSCNAGSSQVIIVNPSPTVNVAASDALICKGGTSSLTASGTASTYLWSTTASSPVITVNPTQTTTYSVTGTDTGNGCSTTATVEVAVFDPTVAITGNFTVCSGASATLTANGANSYTWSNGSPFQSITVSPTITSTYTVSATSSSVNIFCQGAGTVLVNVNPTPSVAAMVSRTVICRGENVTISASGASSYSWNTSATTASFVVTPTIITNINYVVTGTDASGCSSTASVQVKVNACNSIHENEAGEGLVLYPNPNNGNFAISAGSAMQLVLVNSLGQTVKELSLLEENGFKATISGLPAGVYFVAGQANGKTLLKKVIIQD